MKILPNLKSLWSEYDWTKKKRVFIDNNGSKSTAYVS